MSKINKVAILIDGGFFIQRFKALNKKKNPGKADVEKLIEDIMQKLNAKSGTSFEDILFRSYYYDCYPFDKKIKDPAGTYIDFSASPINTAQTAFINSLKTIDQFALRLGDLSFAGWKFKTHGATYKHVPDFRQKGVDMKIGLDMAWIAGRKTVTKMVLVAGDSDFISPIKFVRREGILVYVYPMGNNIKDQLVEHSDFILV